MKTHGITAEQLSSIYDLIQDLQDLNNGISGEKVSGLTMYKDDQGNFFAAYTYTGTRDGAPYNSIIRVGINPDGKTFDPTVGYSNPSFFDAKLRTLQQITF